MCELISTHTKKAQARNKKSNILPKFSLAMKRTPPPVIMLIIIIMIIDNFDIALFSN